MGTRVELQTVLENVLGTRHVYFQPPESIKLQYPCIVYKRSDIDSEHAGNKIYKQKKRYSVTVIDRDPDSLIPDMVGSLPYTEYNRHYTTDNLNHDVYILYF